MRAAPLKLSVVGAGAMGSSLLEAWSKAKGAEGVPELALSGIDPSPKARERLEALDIPAYASLEEAPVPECVVMAVKPQIIDAALAELRDVIDQRGDEAPMPLAISIAAGIPLERLTAALPAGAPVVRTMPNLALTVGRSVTALCARAGEEDVSLAERLFGVVGATYRVDESAMDAVCALSGSGPAYFALLAEMMAQAGAELGLEPAMAQDLATQTLIGTAELLRRRGLAPEALRRAVTSPQGTTEAAVKTMERLGFEEVVDAGVKAAFERGRELGREAGA